MVNVRFPWISSRNSPVFRYLKDFCKCRYYSGPCNEPGFVITTAAAAKSLQSGLTLCDLMDHSPPGSFVHGILQAIGVRLFSGGIRKRIPGQEEGIQESSNTKIGSLFRRIQAE